MEAGNQEGQKQGLNFDQIIQKNRNEQLLKEYEKKLKTADFIYDKIGKLFKKVGAGSIFNRSIGTLQEVNTRDAPILGHLLCSLDAQKPDALPQGSVLHQSYLREAAEAGADAGVELLH